MTDQLTLTTTIATLLPHWQGKGWSATCDSHRNNYQITHPDGPSLTLGLQHQGSKQYLTVRAHFSTAPEAPHSFQALCDRLNWETAQKAKDGIKLSPDRPPTDLAKDIQRRLLQEYLPLYQQGLEAMQAQQAELNECKQLLQSLATDLEVRADLSKMVCRKFKLASLTWVEITVNSPEKLTVELRGISPAQWARVLQTLRHGNSGTTDTDPTEPPQTEGQ